MKDDDVEKMAFNTKYGLFEYLFISMQAFHPPVTFNRLKDQIFHDCMDDIVMVHIDDL